MEKHELMQQAIHNAGSVPSKARVKARCFAIRRGDLLNACLEPGFARDARPRTYAFPAYSFAELVLGDSLNGSTGGHCVVLPEFFTSFAKTEFFASWLRLRQRITASPSVQTADFKTLKVPVPSVGIQQALVSKLEAAHTERNQSLAEANRLLDSIGELTRQRLFLPELPPKKSNGYGVRLSELRNSSSISAAHYHPERMLALKAVQTIPHAALGSLVSFERRKCQASDAQYVGLASVSSHTGQFLGLQIANGMRFAFDREDILYGSLRPYLNKCWLATFAGECSTEFFVMRVLDRQKLLPAYLSLVMRTQVVSLQARYALTGSALPRLSQEDAAFLLIPIASKEVQQRITAEASDIQDEADRLKAHAEIVWQKACESFERKLVMGMINSGNS